MFMGTLITRINSFPTKYIVDPKKKLENSKTAIFVYHIKLETERATLFENGNVFRHLFPKFCRKFTDME